MVYRDWLDLYQQFELMDDDKKAEVLDLKHTEITAVPATERGQAAYRKWEHMARIAAHMNVGVQVELFFKLASINDTNSHVYRDGLSRCAETSGNTQPVNCALFSTASKAAHSCSSNCMFSTRFNLRYLTMIASKPIARGDLITISYIELLGSIEARRMKLEQEKDFYCNCPKCAGPDYVRGIQCGKNGCNGIKLGTMGRGEDAYSWVSWRCQECGDEKDATSCLVKAESEIQGLLDMFKHQVELGAITIDLPESRLGEVITQAAAELSPTHFLVADLYRVQAECNVTLASSLEADASSNDKYKRFTQGCRLDSALARMNAIRTMECAEAGCLEGASVCRMLHTPAGVCGTEALLAFKDLQLAFPGYLQKYIPFIQRYLSFLAFDFGAYDEDVREIAAYIAQISNRENVESTLVCAWPDCINTQGESRLLQCSRCKKVAYCDVNCQRAHWKAGHKRECA